MSNITGVKTNMAKVFYESVVNGETVLVNYTTTAAALPFAVAIAGRPGIGKKFWTWPTVTEVRYVVGADFTNAPTVQNTALGNQTVINAITATPEDVLIWSYPTE